MSDDFFLFCSVEQLTSKTHWTKEDLALLHEDFKKVDVDKSGELDFKVGARKGAFVFLLLKSDLPG